MPKGAMSLHSLNNIFSHLSCKLINTDKGTPFSKEKEKKKKETGRKYIIHLTLHNNPLHNPLFMTLITVL
jgi:hypothetical protein